MAFKGGTCLRKCIYGKNTRFSVDLDFTNVNNQLADDVILSLVSVFEKPAYGLSFQLDTKDFYVSDDKLSCGATVKYKHNWFQGIFKLEISLREQHSLPLVKLPLQIQPYFKYLEFQPFSIQSLRFEELLAEKIRASIQRLRARDLYDLSKAADQPFQGDIVRALTVIKCWNTRTAFDPSSFLQRLRSAKYDWSDLSQLMRRSEKIDTENLISKCEHRYQFLLELSNIEKNLINDARGNKRKNLPQELLRSLQIS